MNIIGKQISWRPKGKTCAFMTGFIAQYRLEPARIEIVSKKGSAYGTWIHICDVEFNDHKKEDEPKK